MYHSIKQCKCAELLQHSGFKIASVASNSLKQMEDRRNDFIITENKRHADTSNERLYYPFLIGNDNDVDVKNSSYATPDTTNNN